MLYKAGDDPFADVKFQVESTTIWAHKAILVARSTYFAPCSHATGVGLAESQGVGPVTIGDTTPGAFKAILLYLYTDCLDFEDEEVVHVMRKAMEMQLDRVYNHCVRHCARKVSVHNSVLWFSQADQFRLADLRESAKRFTARNLRRIKDQDGGTLTPCRWSSCSRTSLR